MGKRWLWSLLGALLLTAGPALAFEVDTFDTGKGPLKITFIGHGSLMLEHSTRVIQVDPFGKLADYEQLPDADIILITHGHRDHLDKDAVAAVRKSDTLIVYSRVCDGQIPGAAVLENGMKTEVLGYPLEAVPAYNLVHMRDTGEPFHPRGEGNGYILEVGDKRIYIAGDTENIPEMREFGRIDIAFVPMNLPYTMTPEMAADAARMLEPAILYPYHYGDTETAKLLKLLTGSGIDVRIRKMK